VVCHICLVSAERYCGSSESVLNLLRKTFAIVRGSKHNDN
jgi:hypothetical protein